MMLLRTSRLVNNILACSELDGYTIAVEEGPKCERGGNTGGGLME